MATDYKIKDQKLQYDIEAAKIRELSYRKIDKYEYLRGKEILLSHQRQMIEQARFTYSPLGKDFEKKKKKLTEEQARKRKDARWVQAYKKNFCNAAQSNLPEAAQTSMKAANETSPSLVDAVCYKITVSARLEAKQENR